MKVDATDPRVEGLAKHLAGKTLVEMTGLASLAEASPDIINRAVEAVWSEKNDPKDMVIKDRFRNQAADILNYLDKVYN